MAYPEAPWRLQGELIVVPARTPGRQIGGVMLANYTGGTLAYRELIVFSHATTHGMVISHIYVDDERSMQGGIHIWGLPKELATFEYERDRFTARQGDVTLLHAKIRRRRGVIRDPAADADHQLDGRHAWARRASRPRPRWSSSRSRTTARSRISGCTARTSRSPATSWT